MSASYPDLRCIACTDGRVEATADDAGASLRCVKCDAAYAEIWGVPFIGRYDRFDVPGLIEIAANISNRGRFGITPDVVAEWETNLAAYHAAADKQALLNENPALNSPFLLNRYGEWVELQILTEGMDLKGRRILDLGAGLGFDSQRLALKGAEVTALEFSPILAEWGAQNFPHIRWIGGLAEVLPFKSASFDYVFCNAALHHFRDIPVVLSEGLRVLREGGVMITTCDSFRADGTDDLTEALVFDRDPAVLLGVNERVPRFNEFAQTLQKHRDNIDVRIFTHTLYNAPADNGETRTLNEFTPWDFDRDKEMLAERSGSIALKVTLKKSLDLTPPVQASSVLEAAQFASTLSDQSSAIARLTPLIPEELVDLPFPGEPGPTSKFELRNGWRVATAGAQFRSAYKRGRWFLRRSGEDQCLSFEVRPPQGDGRQTVGASVLLNGSKVQERPLQAGKWSALAIDLGSCEVGVPFCVEIQIETSSDEVEKATFDVRRRRFAGQSLEGSNWVAGLRRWLKSAVAGEQKQTA